MINLWNSTKWREGILAKGHLVCVSISDAGAALDLLWDKSGSLITSSNSTRRHTPKSEQAKPNWNQYRVEQTTSHPHSPHYPNWRRPLLPQALVVVNVSGGGDAGRDGSSGADPVREAGCVWWRGGEEGGVCQRPHCGRGPAGPSGGPVIGLGFYTWTAQLLRDDGSKWSAACCSHGRDVKMAVFLLGRLQSCYLCHYNSAYTR